MSLSDPPSEGMAPELHFFLLEIIPLVQSLVAFPHRAPLFKCREEERAPSSKLKRRAGPFSRDRKEDGGRPLVYPPPFLSSIPPRFFPFYFGSEASSLFPFVLLFSIPFEKNGKPPPLRSVEPSCSPSSFFPTADGDLLFPLLSYRMRSRPFPAALADAFLPIPPLGFFFFFFLLQFVFFFSPVARGLLFESRGLDEIAPQFPLSPPPPCRSLLFFGRLDDAAPHPNRLMESSLSRPFPPLPCFISVSLQAFFFFFPMYKKPISLFFGKGWLPYKATVENGTPVLPTFSRAPFLTVLRFSREGLRFYL